MPEPLAPEMCRPVRKVVKMARPAQVWIALGGMVIRDRVGLPLGPGLGLGVPGRFKADEEEGRSGPVCGKLSAVVECVRIDRVK